RSRWGLAARAPRPIRSRTLPPAPRPRAASANAARAARKVPAAADIMRNVLNHRYQPRPSLLLVLGTTRTTLVPASVRPPAAIQEFPPRPPPYPRAGPPR